MDTTLVVVRPFGPHAIGDRITDAAAVQAILAGEHASSVVSILTPTSTKPTEH